MIDIRELTVKKTGKEILDLNLKEFDMDKLLGKHRHVMRRCLIMKKVEKFTDGPMICDPCYHNHQDRPRSKARQLETSLYSISYLEPKPSLPRGKAHMSLYL